MREQLAEACHKQWSEWARYMFSQCSWVCGSAIVPVELVNRWKRQLRTPYGQLLDEEKEPDRKMADELLKTIRECAKQYDPEEIARVIASVQPIPSISFGFRITDHPAEKEVTHGD